MARVRYQDLSSTDRREALEVADHIGNQRAHLLEKDVWVVAVLSVLFKTPFAQYLTFKGGTSLSKAWHVIRRFSEDIDITYDIRAFAPDLVLGAGDESLPPTRSQEKRWTRTIRKRLDEWVRHHARSAIEEELLHTGFDAGVRADAECLYVEYKPLFADSEFVRPEVKLEFGARSTGEPNQRARVVCDAAAHLPDLIFPQTCPNVMLAERTFWEKATAIHVYCRQQRRRGERLSRHWHDLARLDEVGVAQKALSDRELANSVAKHKEKFFVENDNHGERIDYLRAVSGFLQLVPTGQGYEVLADDYAAMLADGMLLNESESFDAMMEQCSTIEARANEFKA